MADYVVRMTGQDNLSGTIKQVKSELNDLGKTTSKLDKVDAKFSKITQSAVGVKRELRELNNLGSQLKFDGDYNAAQLLKIAQAAGEAKDSVGDFHAMANYFADDNRHLNTAVQAMQGLAAAGSVTAGVLGMVGVEQEKVNQAILWCQSALSVLNGLNTIANVLNKDSYVSMAMKVAGLKAEAAATDKATASQVRLNAAVLTNPYVLAAAAIAALVAGIAVWVSSMDEATEEEAALTAATDAFKEAAEQQSSTLANQLSTFESLKKIYDESGGKVDILTKKIINNKEAQRILGVTLKTVDDVHRLFGKNSTNYVNASIARANALSSEQAQAVLLGNTLKELNTMYAKLMKGEEVDWIDMEKVLAKSFGSSKAKQMMQQAGGNQTWDWFYSNLEVQPDKIADFMVNLNRIVHDEFYKSGPGKVLGDFIEKSLSLANANEIDFNDLLADNAAGTSTASGSKGSNKGGKTNVDKAKETVTGLINIWEDLISTQEKAVKNATTEQGIKDAKAKLDQYKTEYANFRIKVGLDVDPKAEEAKKSAEEAAKKYQENMEKAFAEYVKLDVAYSSRPSVDPTNGLSSFQKATGEFVDKNSLQGIETMMNYNDKLIDQLETLAQKYIDMGATSTDMYKNIIEWIKKLKNEQKDLGGEATTINETNEKLDLQQKKFNGIVEAVGNVGQAFSTLGEMTEDKGINAAGIVAQAIAQLALSYAFAVSKAGKELGWVGWLVAGTSGLATLVAMIAQLHSLTGYASGGIISGGSSYGDQILARVNAGEMVLNRKQQSNLFRAIESGNIGAGQTVLVPEFKIKGSDLYGTLRNFSKSVGKTGKVTGIR